MLLHHRLNEITYDQVMNQIKIWHWFEKFIDFLRTRIYIRKIKVRSWCNENLYFLSSRKEKNGLIVSFEFHIAPNRKSFSKDLGFRRKRLITVPSKPFVFFSQNAKDKYQMCFMIISIPSYLFLCSFHVK